MTTGNIFEGIFKFISVYNLAQALQPPRPEPGLGMNLDGERLVDVSTPMGPIREQTEEAKWVPIPMGSPPVSGAKGVRCIVAGWWLKARNLAVQSLGAEARSESPLWWGRRLSWCTRFRLNIVGLTLK